MRQRPEGSELVSGIIEGKITEVFVQDIDRLGRNLRDILTTLDLFKKHNVITTVETIGCSKVNGKANPVFNLMVGILGTVAEMGRDKILENAQAGREIGKAKGNFKGRKVGTVISREQTLIKYRVEIKLIKAHPELSLMKLQKLTGSSVWLISKLKKMV